MAMTLDEASKQAQQILERALSAGYEMLITPDKNPDEIVSQAQKLYDIFIREARKLTGTAAASLGQTSEEIVHVSFDELYNAYNSNPLRAKRKYDGKTLSISGTVSSIEEDKTGFSLELCALPSERSYSSDGIYCSFGLEHEDAMLELTSGQVITVTGRFAGDGNSYLEGVYLEDCRITA